MAWMHLVSVHFSSRPCAGYFEVSRCTYMLRLRNYRFEAWNIQGDYLDTLTSKNKFKIISARFSYYLAPCYNFFHHWNWTHPKLDIPGATISRVLRRTWILNLKLPNYILQYVEVRTQCKDQAFTVGDTQKIEYSKSLAGSESSSRGVRPPKVKHARIATCKL